MKKIVEVEKTLCDDCGNEVIGTGHKCAICGIDLCGNCVIALYQQKGRDTTAFTPVMAVCKDCLKKVTALKKEEP